MIEVYNERISNARKEIKNHTRKSNFYSILRLLTIAAGFIAIYQSIQFEKIWLTEITFLLIVILFAWLVKMQSKHVHIKNFHSDLEKINQNEIDCIQKGKNIYPNGSDFIDNGHFYTSDLDIFGEVSLYNLLNRCATKQGNKKLSDWLSSPYKRNKIIERQKAVHELSENMDWRQNFQAKLLFANHSEPDSVKKILLYLKNETTEVSKFLSLYTKFIPLIFVITLGISIFYNQFFILVIVLAIINLFIIQSFESKIDKTETLIGKAGKLLAQFSDAFHLIENKNWESDLNKNLAAKLSDASQKGFFKRLKELSVLISRMELRSGILIGFLLNVSSVWVVRQYIAIEKWKKSNLKVVEAAFNVLTEFEALLSLANLKVNNLNWVFPEISEDENYTLIATQIGHPLISGNQRVVNDFDLENALKIDIVTGSNMAGKSTFLRTLGINSVLALSGSVVCATKMKITPMLIFSYMRIKDSLNENTSTFKAELDRLKLLLDKLSEDSKIYFLIDEMLRGTNSVDKYRGSKAIIEKLIHQKAVGMVATHDLQIAHMEKDHPDYIRNFHFDIEIIKGEMLFDYKLRGGECKTFNASVLLQNLGIHVKNNPQ